MKNMKVILKELDQFLHSESMIYLITLIFIAVAVIFSMLSSYATEMTKTTVSGPYLTSDPTDNSLNVTWNSATTTIASNTFACAGHDLVIARFATGVISAINPNATAVITLHRASTPYGISRDVTYTFEVGEMMNYWINNTVGWVDSNNAVLISSSTDNVEFGILTIAR